MYWKCCANAPVIEVQEKKTEEKEDLIERKVRVLIE